ncbi:MAG: hypothetical protein Phyf2KO_12050 [Phycisphaerales bacterium]
MLRYTITARFRETPEVVADTILDLAQWSSFRGWGPLPGIRSAEFLEHMPDVVGTRIGVTNTDGSRHVEEIVEWDVGHRLHIRLCEFPKPLSLLADRFDEYWIFGDTADGSLADRVIEIVPRHLLGRMVLPIIGWMLMKAIRRHITDLGGEIVSVD